MVKDKELLMEMLHLMMRIRFFEEKAVKLMQTGQLVGWVHPYVGEEAVAVGVCSALQKDDYIVGTHRSHGHPIAKGLDLKRAMAELMGKATGNCKGKGGSMHLADFSLGILGESGIVGSGLPVGIGAALASKMQKNGRISVCFFGDGASNQGTFHETINLAAVWKLPVIFVCENNQYAQTSSFRKFLNTENIAIRATAYNIPGVFVDGQKVLDVFDAAKTAADRARNGQGPTLIEALTYRYYDHSVAVATIVRRPYRTEEEINEYKLHKDPIMLHKQYLLDHSLVTEDEIMEMENAVQNEVKEAEEFGRNSPFPGPEALFEDLFDNPIPPE